MLRQIAARLMLAPFLLRGKGARVFWAIQGGMAVAELLLACVWLATPIALWSAFGFGWTLAWTVPTTFLIYLVAATPDLPG